MSRWVVAENFDDEPAVRDALIRALKAQHYSVTIGTHGRQASARSHSP